MLFSAALPYMALLAIYWLIDYAALAAPIPWAQLELGCD